MDERSRGGTKSSLVWICSSLASAGVGFRGERLSYVGLEPLLGAVLTFLDEPGVPRLLERSLPGRFIVADCARSQNATLRAMEKASEIVDLRESARQSQEALERGLRTRNPIVQISLPSLSRARVAQEEGIARFRLLRAAVLLEKARVRDGRYPADATALQPVPARRRALHPRRAAPP